MTFQEGHWLDDYDVAIWQGIKACVVGRHNFVKFQACVGRCSFVGGELASCERITVTTCLAFIHGGMLQICWDHYNTGWVTRQFQWSIFHFFKIYIETTSRRATFDQTEVSITSWPIPGTWLTPRNQVWTSAFTMSVWLSRIDVFTQCVFLFLFICLLFHVSGPLECQSGLCSVACELRVDTYLHTGLPSTA